MFTSLIKAYELKLLFGTPDNFHLHMEGLEQMINVRGGLQSIRSSNQDLELFITWSVFRLSVISPSVLLLKLLSL